MNHWNTILAIDADRWASEVYRANFPSVRVECGPVADYLDKLPTADVLIGGPPCQPFSDAGDNEGEKDERDCIPDFIEAVRRVQPRMFLMENVRGLLRERHWPYFCRTLTALSDAGYAVAWKPLGAVSFGVPQFRERVWLWGIRKDLYAAGMRHSWPKPTHAWPPPETCMFGVALLPGVTTGQALGIDGWYDAQNDTVHGPEEPCGTIQGNAQAKGGKAGHYAIRRVRGSGVVRRDHPTDEPCPTVMQPTGGKSGLLLISGSKCRKDANGTPRGPLVKSVENPSFAIDGNPPSFEVYRWSDAMLQRHPPALPALPAPTVQAKWFKGGAEGLLAFAAWKRKDDLWIRRLTVLECARLQSVPDCFVWPEKITKTAGYRIVGNGWASRMGQVFSEAFAAVDPESKTVIDLFCGGGLGDCGWHGRAWTYEAREAVLS